MGLLRGSASFSRYFIKGVPPEDFLDAYKQSLNRYSFKGFDEFTDAERSTGWVSIMDIFDTGFDQKQFYMYPYLSMSFRVDTRNVPSNALKQHCLEAERKVRLTENLEYIPKERRREIKEITQAALLKRAIPRTNTYDMIWNMKTGMLFFGSVSSKICDEFATLFFKTFDLNLNPVFPYSLAFQNLEGAGATLDALDSIRTFYITGDQDGRS
jgi:DNA recombination-dependent growth factor C